MADTLEMSLLRSERDSLKQQLADAHTEAVALFNSMPHENPVEPLKSTAGLVSQINNSVAGLCARLADALRERDELRQRLVAGQACAAHDVTVAALREQNATLMRERDELQHLLSPEVQAAAKLIAANADRHPEGCCPKCRQGLQERDQALREKAEVEARFGGFVRQFLRWYPDVAQLLDGWHADGTTWTEHDSRVRRDLIALGKVADTLNVNNGEGGTSIADLQQRLAAAEAERDALREQLREKLIIASTSEEGTVGGAAAEIIRLERERDQALRDLHNLLAVIHRDGGHYTEATGLSRSVQDAHEAISQERVALGAALFAPVSPPGPFDRCEKCGIFRIDCPCPEAPVSGMVECELCKGAAGNILCPKCNGTGKVPR